MRFSMLASRIRELPLMARLLSIAGIASTATMLSTGVLSTLFGLLGYLLSELSLPLTLASVLIAAKVLGRKIRGPIKGIASLLVGVLAAFTLVSAPQCVSHAFISLRPLLFLLSTGALALAVHNVGTAGAEHEHAV